MQVVVAGSHGFIGGALVPQLRRDGHLVRTLVAGILGMPENLLRVITPEVGGGFGSKCDVYAEEALMAFIARKINVPVKWVESRRENFTTTIHGRGHVDYFELAAKRDGTMLGLRL